MYTYYVIFIWYAYIGRGTDILLGGSPKGIAKAIAKQLMLIKLGAVPFPPPLPDTFNLPIPAAAAAEEEGTVTEEEVVVTLSIFFYVVLFVFFFFPF